ECGAAHRTGTHHQQSFAEKPRGALPARVGDVRRFEAAETGHGEWEDCCAERDRWGRRSQTVVATKNRDHCCGRCGDRGCGYGRGWVACPSSRAEELLVVRAALRQGHLRAS